MTNFFENQEDARRRTGWLVFLSVLGICGVIAAVYVPVYWFLHWEAANACAETGRTLVPVPFWDQERFTVVAAITAVVITAASLWKIIALAAGGGAAIATALGGELLTGTTDDKAEQTLLNVVEEMAIASGMAPPPVYILREEEGINAFAAGLKVTDAVIGVTLGAVRTLKRDELQGVVAHEFSHILNGDARLNVALIGWLHGILFISLIGQALMRARGRNSGQIWIFGLGLFIIGSIGHLFGQLIRAAVSRQREFLADAAAVQYTRNPLGLAGALAKIGKRGSRLDAERAGEASHLFFGSALSSWLLFASHPPLLARIKQLDPGFVKPADWSEATGVDADSEMASNLTQKSTLWELRQDSEKTIGTIGAPLKEHLQQVRATLATVPETILAAARTTGGAPAVIYGLLLHRDAEIRQSQLQQLAAAAGPGISQSVGQLAGEFVAIGRPARLPLLTIAAASLEGIDQDDFDTLYKSCGVLIAADEREDLFELAARQLLLKRIGSQFDKSGQWRQPGQKLAKLTRECSTVLTCLAWPARDPQDAFAAGAACLGSGDFVFNAKIERGEFEAALTRLEGASYQEKKKLLEGCLACICRDERVTLDEMELFRTIALAIDCPVPPFLEEVFIQGEGGPEQ